MSIPEGPLTLLIAIGIILIIGVFVHRRNESRYQKKVINKNEDLISAGVVEMTSTEESTKAGISGWEISPAIVAAITASLCVITGKSAAEIKFSAIRRAPGGQSMWSTLGTMEIMASRKGFVERGR